MTYPQEASETPQKTLAPGWYPDPATGFVRWWNGHAWGVYQQTQLAPARNGYATASLILGICGFVLMAVPFFIGWVVGGIPDLLAVLFGILGLVKAARLGGNGRMLAVIGLVLAGMSILSTLMGAGTLW